MKGQSDLGPGRRLRGPRRKAVLTVHLIAALGLLGASTVLLVGGLHAATRDHPDEAHAVYTLLRLLTFAVDVPLAIITLLAGLVLAFTSTWRIFGDPLGDDEARPQRGHGDARGRPARPEHRHDARRHRIKRPRRQQHALEAGGPARDAHDHVGLGRHAWSAQAGQSPTPSAYAIAVHEEV